MKKKSIILKNKGIFDDPFELVNKNWRKKLNLDKKKAYQRVFLVPTKKKHRIERWWEKRNLQTNATRKGIGDLFFVFIVIKVFQCCVLHFLNAETENLESKNCTRRKIFNVPCPSVPNYKKKKKSHLLRKLKHKNLKYSFLCFLWKKFHRKM